jgi:hypothetical protein
MLTVGEACSGEKPESEKPVSVEPVVEKAASEPAAPEAKQVKHVLISREQFTALGRDELLAVVELMKKGEATIVSEIEPIPDICPTPDPPMKPGLRLVQVIEAMGAVPDPEARTELAVKADSGEFVAIIRDLADLRPHLRQIESPEQALAYVRSYTTAPHCLRMREGMIEIGQVNRLAIRNFDTVRAMLEEPRSFTAEAGFVIERNLAKAGGDRLEVMRCRETVSAAGDYTMEQVGEVPNTDPPLDLVSYQ